MKFTPTWPEKRPRNAANEPIFMPAVCSDPEFISWACRVALRLVNLPRGPSKPATEQQMRGAMFKEFTPGPEWAAGLKFMMELAFHNKLKARTLKGVQT